MSRVSALLGFVCFSVILFSSPASAWDGFYAGGSLGFAKGTYLQVDENGGEGVEVDVEGAMASARFGMNKRNGNNVLGFDIDVGNGPSGVTPQGTSGSSYFCGSGDCSIDIKALATIRGRYGVLIDESSLAYAAGGLAVGKIEGGIENSSYFDSSTATGYTIGIGYERKFNDQMSYFAEINYVDLGDLAFGTTGSLDFLGEGNFSNVRIGVNYQF